MATTKRDLIVIGASAGGLEALKPILRGLPGDLPAAVLVVIHTGGTSNFLAKMLGGMGDLPAEYATDGARIQHGRIYVAPGDHHLLVEPDVIRLVRGPKENGFRPAVDPTFRTAASSHGSRTVGVILSGARDDGVHGLKEIKARGGVAIVQHPEDAMVDGMPLSAIRAVEIDHITPAAEIPQLLASLARSHAGNGGDAAPRPPRRPAESSASAAPADEPRRAHAGGSSSGPRVVRGDLASVMFGCPACGGPLREMRQDPPLFCCHVGHTFAPESLAGSQIEAFESALWSAVRVLKEHATLQRRMARRAEEGRLLTLADTYETNARVAEQKAAVIRSVLVREGNGAPDLLERTTPYEDALATQMKSLSELSEGASGPEEGN